MDGTNLLVSVSTNGGPADGISSQPAMSADGRFVVFTSAADNLVPGDANNAADVFMRSLPDGPTVLVSVSAGGLGPGNGPSGAALISSNGNYVLFNSQATDLTGDSFGSETTNLFLRDLGAGMTYALTTGGVNSASMTPDGRLIAFTDLAGASEGKIYIWDSQAAARISTNSISLWISAISLSADGNKIVCLAGTNSTTPTKVGFVDRLTGTNALISSGYGSGSRVGLRFNANGQFLAYAAAPSAFGTNQIYVYDFQTHVETLVSTAFGLTSGANASSDSPDISADGRYIAFRSFATNLMPGGDSNNVPDVFLYDRVSRTSTLLSGSGLTGGPADNRSRTPVFSPNGHTLFFQSWAPDLVPLDFNQSGDVLALAFLYVSIIPAGTPGVGPTLTWPNRPGETYQVQYKNALSEPAWQAVSGNVTITGNQASLTDLAPSSGVRFYRVVAF